MNKIKHKILITGGAGFIGSNLVDYFLEKGYSIVCLDNLSTGYLKNIQNHSDNNNFTFIEGDIRNFETCRKAAEGCDYVFHQAALGSVPRSIKDPITSNNVNISGFVNVIIAARDEGVKRFIYAASSSTYGDSKSLPKVEEHIGNPLSPYAITKYVNELYANVFSTLYGLECIGLRYFNVFGKRQDPNGAYAAVIPLWVKNLLNHESPVINGDGSYSRDFTYIDNVIHAVEQAAFTSSKEILSKLNSDKKGFSLVFNTAYGQNTNLNELFSALKDNLSMYDSDIKSIEAVYGPFREGDIPHSLASIEKAQKFINYNPTISARAGFELAAKWYFENIG